METIEKIERVDVRKIKSDIQILSDLQRSLKNQRKTEKLQGERTMEPWVAAYKHQSNREDLRLMYAAYGLMRGKSFSVTENRFPEEGHPLNEFKSKIENLVQKYTKIEEE